MTRTRCGWRFASSRARFAAFTVHAAIERWERGQGAYHWGSFTAHFPGTAVRIRFACGSLLLAFPSGHIRWISELGFRYYATLSQGVPPSYRQGDLVVFRLTDGEVLPHRVVLDDMLPEDGGTLWPEPKPADPKSVGVWQEVDALDVGGNARHRALGRLKYLTPVEKDYRTVQAQTLAKVFIHHDPIDEVHPAIYLPPHQHYLISKLPGFSDPVRETPDCQEVSA